jgi:hypothetical protein
MTYFWNKKGVSNIVYRKDPIISIHQKTKLFTFELVIKIAKRAEYHKFKGEEKICRKCGVEFYYRYHSQGKYCPNCGDLHYSTEGRKTTFDNIRKLPLGINCHARL